MSELSIKVQIAGRTYPLTINRDEEEGIRKVAKQIDENIERLASSYAVKDKQDLLAMTALQYGSKLAAKSTEEGESKSVEMLTGLSTFIDELNKP
jgi:cell division protein ZapA